jgi:hypothetical protein
MELNTAEVSTLRPEHRILSSIRDALRRGRHQMPLVEEHDWSSCDVRTVGLDEHLAEASLKQWTSEYITLFWDKEIFENPNDHTDDFDALLQKAADNQPPIAKVA